MSPSPYEFPATPARAQQQSVAEPGPRLIRDEPTTDGGRWRRWADGREQHLSAAEFDAEQLADEVHVQEIRAQVQAYQEQTHEFFTAENAFTDENGNSLIEVSSLESTWIAPTSAQAELLVHVAQLLDQLTQLDREQIDQLLDLLNELAAERWGSLPCYEFFRAIDGPVIGFRLNALEAVILPRQARDLAADWDDTSDEPEPQQPWYSDEGVSELDRVVEILADLAEEIINDNLIYPENGPAMAIVYVQGNRICDQRAWNRLRTALGRGPAGLWRPIPDTATPILWDRGYQIVATSVNQLMASSAEPLVVWEALREAHLNERALLPYTDGQPEDLLTMISANALEEQLLAYQAAYPELHLAELRIRYQTVTQGFIGREQIHANPDPAPGFEAWRQHRYLTSGEHWDPIELWWIREDRETFDRLRGQWVAFMDDEFCEYRRVASHSDLETLQAQVPSWRWIVSVPEIGFDGLVIDREQPEPAPRSPQPEE